MTLLIFSFDGSGKDPETGIQEQQYGGKTSDNNITNVVKLHLLCGGNLFFDGPVYGHATQQNVNRAFYYAGVGAYGNKLQQLVNMAVAPESLDVATVLNKAMQDFIGCVSEHNNDLTVLITGYSRGAALARRFATLIHHYLDRNGTRPASPFIYLCVWDTVASIGMPDISTQNRPKYDVVFEDGYSLCASVCQANHMVSLDEKRRSFQPTLINYDPARALEVWFAGAHGDIGGGFLRDGLSDITLQYSIQWLQRMQQVFALPSLDFSLPTETDLDKACPAKVRKAINQDDLKLTPNPMGKNHQQERLAILESLTLYDRICGVVHQNKIDESLSPLIHYSVPVRIYRDQRYNPVSLSRMTTAHKVWRDYNAPPQAYQGIQPHQEITQHNWQTLAVGESATVIVDADRKFNHSGVLVSQGESYAVNVAGEQTWNDADICCDAEGWDRDDISKGLAEILIAAAESGRRIPDVNWFCLCTAIGTDENSYIAVGKYRQLAINQTGELTFFANDLDARYHNNWGYIEVTVRRII